jgi:very-short-patch-repair endonuclease
VSERWRSRFEGCDESAKVRVAALASRQHGVVATRQLRYLGIAGALLGRWTDRGDLHPVHRGVYAVGHIGLSTAGWLTAAVLYAGPGAMLSHVTAAWWLALTSRRPDVIQVSTPRRCTSVDGIEVHGRRPLDRVWHNHLPVAPLAHVLLDYAATHGHDDIRYVLAQAEHRGWLDVEVLQGECRRGRPGSAALRKALSRHQPQLGRTRSEFERRMIYLCERYALPIPEFNVIVAGQLVDALWRAHRLIVELDGKDAHSRWGQIQADHARDLILRRARHTVHRYTWAQLEHDHAAVAQDVLRALAAV